MASGHGRLEERGVSLGAAEPLATGFPFRRTIVRIHSWRTIKKTGQSTADRRYDLASQELAQRRLEGWIDLSRQPWAGVENRHHWRRDATMGEDGPRLRKSRALANLARLRSVTLRLLAASGGEGWQPAQKEHLAANPPAALTLIKAK